MNSVANPVCFLAPLVKNIQKISLSGGGDSGTDRLAHLGLPWGLMHVHIHSSPGIRIEEFIEHYDAIDPAVYDTLFGLVKTTTKT